MDNDLAVDQASAEMRGSAIQESARQDEEDLQKAPKCLSVGNGVFIARVPR
ncbi:hypothetical protein [Bradyrhizobium sp. JYMT SZCCT0180]|uniref:hypothetical protein n=1 Tax=Bradyrhizobium sp. JYMT SZCCT0180 TaxID=2807666 RepID=UPI001BA9890D|nr:hypothetical protein [Bradyrhizobium sp. JYMT SZCCT0180]MBR1215849.1 hypothetical protein [Bradyrhizobium sp. JYMT SZCCT0180]